MQTSGFGAFLTELKRRKVIRVGSVYAVVAFGVVQGASALIPMLELPAWTGKLVVLLVLLGFPIALAMAWALEVTPEGVRRTEQTMRTPARLAFVGVLLAVTAGLGVLAWKRDASPDNGALAAAATSQADFRSIAVLPFDNMSSDAENEYFSDGVTEDILTNLSKIGDLRVVSRTSVMKYKNSEKGIPEIARELGVRHVVEGSVRRAGDQVRITAQLIDATDTHLWAEEYTRKLEDIFAIQSEISKAIASALHATLSASDTARLAVRATGDVAAYDDFLRGRAYYRLYTPDANENAIQLFRRAIAKDPDYAEAWAGLADALAQRSNRFGYPTEWIDSSLVAARKSVALRDDLADGYKAIGLSYWVLGQDRKALQANVEALERNPNYITAIGNTGYASLRMGRLKDALERLTLPLTREPNVAEWQAGLALPLIVLEEDEAALRAVQKARDMQPDNVNSVVYLIYLGIMRGDLRVAREQAELAHPGVLDDLLVRSALADLALFAGDAAAARRYVEAADTLQTSFVLAGFGHSGRSMHALALRLTGERARSDARFEQILQLNRKAERDGADTSVMHYENACAHAAQGRRDVALRSLRKAVDAGWLGARFAARDPFLASLRGDPEFQRLLAEMKTRVAKERSAARAAGLL